MVFTYPASLSPDRPEGALEMHPTHAATKGRMGFQPIFLATEENLR